MSAAGADYSAIYDPDTDFDSRYTMATVRRIAERVAPGDRVLELGCATGLMTGHLAGARRSSRRGSPSPAGSG